MLDKLAIGQRIKSIRAKHGLSQHEFSSAINAGRVTVARYESGGRTPDAEFLLAINQKFGVDAIWLLTGEGSEPIGATALTLREEALLDNYRNTEEQGRRVVEATASAAAKPKPVAEPRNTKKIR